jgi:hypothetical protein
MVVGAEIQARAKAKAALELADAAPGSALVEALSVLVGRDRESAKHAARAAAAEVVRVLAAEGFAGGRGTAAIESLATAGLIELPTLEAAAVEAEDMLSKFSGRGARLTPRQRIRVGVPTRHPGRCRVSRAVVSGISRFQPVTGPGPNPRRGRMITGARAVRVAARGA